jgi:hypothetical protein
MAESIGASRISRQGLYYADKTPVEISMGKLPRRLESAAFRRPSATRVGIQQKYAGVPPRPMVSLGIYKQQSLLYQISGGGARPQQSRAALHRRFATATRGAF